MAEIASEIVVRARAGALKVLGSGTIHVSVDDNVEVEIGPITLQFAFAEDGTKVTRVSAEELGNLVMRIVLHNFANPIGSGTNVPIEIGKAGGRKLFVAFTVYRLSTEKRGVVFHYTAYGE